ncbi:hypothetical protein JD844_017470 [Phrynosoma platyrhinos]|uniref:Fibronectin type-III domain-containing protein n=1 Tax=Phrynosoma platyrhinos TaxID=52577 RepID=A0ABQ7SLZ5_PHRPL|nr:hypothetical protein JD844_017470 [Phrynosoma platyrhinos]
MMYPQSSWLYFFFPGFTVSVYDVTSRSLYIRWSKLPGAFSYRVMATPINTVGHSFLAYFADITVVGTLTPLAPDTVHTVKVEAIDKNGVVLAEAQTMQLTAPEIPTIEQAYSKLSNSITVEWAAVPGASSYLLTAQDGESFIETIVTNSPGTVTGLRAATLYKITIRSINAGGRSQPSLSKKARTVLSAPILTANSSSHDNIVVSWRPVHMAVGFFISIMRADGLGGMLKENTTTDFLIFSSLDPGTLYTIKAHAWDANGIPGDDSTYNQRTRPHAPGDVQVVFDSGALRATISCMPSEGASLYTIAAYSGFSKLNCSAMTASCTIFSLECGTEYSLSVIASNEAGSKSITIEEDEPGNLEVSWSDVDLSDYYVVFVKSDDGLEVHCNTSHTQCHFQSDCGFTYFISVFAYNKAGQSPLGDIFNYTTAPCCPSDFNPVFVSSDTVQIVWSPVRGAEMYETKAVDWANELLCNDTATVCTLSALQCNTQYNITVYSFSEIRGSNTSCASKHVATENPWLCCRKDHSISAYLTILNGTKQNCIFSFSGACCPSGVQLYRLGNNGIRIYWRTSEGSINYSTDLYGSKGNFTCTPNADLTYCDITEIPCGDVYTVVVSPVTDEGSKLAFCPKKIYSGNHLWSFDGNGKCECTAVCSGMQRRSNFLGYYSFLRSHVNVVYELQKIFHLVSAVISAAATVNYI